MKLTRRSFLKKSSLTAATITFADLSYAQPFEEKSGTDNSKLFSGQKIHSVCGMCRTRCLIEAIVEDGRLVKINGNRNWSASDGKICSRGKAAIKMLYDPDRLKYPLKRVGKRGAGKWQRISWGEAIDTIAMKMEEAIDTNGSDSMALFHNGPSSHFIKELFDEIQCPNINNPHWEMCEANRKLAYTMVFGSSGKIESSKFDDSKCIVLLGSHFGENIDVTKIRSLSKAISNGAKLIVVDPRYSTIASKADYHLMIRPGTDTALLLGWLRHIIENSLYNADYTKNNLTGLDNLQEQLSDYNLQDDSEITDIPRSILRKTAEVIAQSAPNLTIYPGQNSNWYGNDTQRLRAKALLTAFLGCWQRSFSADKHQPVQLEKLFPDESSLASSIFSKIHSGKISMIGCWGQNPFQAFPNPYRTTSAFEKLDFVFCCDIYPTETALYSDIILPEASFLERSDILETYEHNNDLLVATRRAVVEPSFESKDPYWIVKQISSRLGKGKNFNFNSIHERIEKELMELAVSKYEVQQIGFAKVQKKSNPLNFLSTQPPKIDMSQVKLKNREDIPLPAFEPTVLPPVGFTRLLMGRIPVHSTSSTTNNPWLMHEVNENVLWLNDKVARKMNINNNDTLYLENQDGIRSVKPVKIKVTPGIRVDCVYLAHGFGCRSPFLSTAFNQGVSDASLLTRTAPDKISGVRGMRVNFIRLVKDDKPLSIPQLDTPPEILKKTHKWWFDSFGSYEKGELRKHYV